MIFGLITHQTDGDFVIATEELQRLLLLLAHFLRFSGSHLPLKTELLGHFKDVFQCPVWDKALLLSSFPVLGTGSNKGITLLFAPALGPGGLAEVVPTLWI